MQNEVTKAVYERVNEEGKIYITSTVVNGVYAIRVVGGGPRVRRETLERAFEVITEVVVAARNVGVDVEEVKEEQVIERHPNVMADEVAEVKNVGYVAGVNLEEIKEKQVRRRRWRGVLRLLRKQ